MNRTLVISSQVAAGHVGLSAIVPVLQAFGADVIALPTIMLSNHPGHPHAAGQAVDVDVLTRMVDALESNGWLGDVSTVLTGYLPTPGHVDFARETIERVAKAERTAAQPAFRGLICDPVLGDTPKGLYIDAAAAEAVRDRLVPQAEIILPNAFELGWLSGHPVNKVAEAVTAAANLAKATMVTSVPTDTYTQSANVWVEATPDGQPKCNVAVTFRIRDSVPNGTGDVFSALLLSFFDQRHRWRLSQSANDMCLDHIAEHSIAGKPENDWPRAALRAATALTDEIIAISAGRRELAIAAALPSLTAFGSQNQVRAT